MATVAPPPLLDFTINAEQVAQLTNDIIEQELATNNKIAALKPEEQTFENIVVPLVRCENALAGEKENTCMRYFSLVFRKLKNSCAENTRQNPTCQLSKPDLS